MNMCRAALLGTFVIAAAPHAEPAQDHTILTEGYKKAREAIRKIETTRETDSRSRPREEKPASRSSSSRSTSGGSRSPKPDPRRAAREWEREEKARIESNLLRLDGWLAQTTETPYAGAAIRINQPDPAAVAVRRRQLDAALRAPNQASYEVELNATTSRGAGLETLALSEAARLKREHARDVRNRIIAAATSRVPFGAKIAVADSNAAAYPQPWYQRVDSEGVTANEAWIDQATRFSPITPDFLRSIIWLETTHGWYDRHSPVEVKSILPMNVYGTGVRILEALWRNTENPTVEKVATLYHNQGETAVTSYGKTVAHYHASKPWRQVPKR
jgi:hypothetical protein